MYSNHFLAIFQRNFQPPFSISDCRVFVYFYQSKRTGTLTFQDEIKMFDEDFRSALEKQDTHFITKFSKTTCCFDGSNFPNDLNLQISNFPIFFSHNLRSNINLGTSTKAWVSTMVEKFWILPGTLLWNESNTSKIQNEAILPTLIRRYVSNTWWVQVCEMK